MKTMNLKRSFPGLVVLLISLFICTLFFPDLSRSQPSEGGTTLVIFVRMDGIRGPSQEENHKGWIEALSFSMGVVDPGAQVGRVGGSQRPVLKPVTIVKPYDMASPQLALDAATGIHIPRVCINVSTPAGETMFSPILVGLHDVQIASVDSTIAEVPSTSLKEVITLTYQKIFWQYNPLNPDGTSGPPVSAGWDARTNTPIKFPGSACF